MTRSVHFGIIGCGKIGTRHAEKLQQIKGAKLAAVCDVKKDRADALAKKYNCKAYFTIEEILSDPEVHYANICTPSGLHPEHTIQALGAQKNVLCEKPMALKEQDAIKMVNVARKEKKKLYVIKQNRYNPPVKLVSSLLRENKLGKPILCTVNMLWNRDKQYYNNDTWRGTLKLDGGTLYTQASHFVDLLLFFMGKPKSLYAQMGRMNHDIEIEDTGVIAVEFENGSFGNLNYTTCSTNKNFEGSITLIFSKGTIKIGGEYLNTIDYFQVQGVESYDLEPTSAEANDYGTYKGSMSNHNKVFQDIVNETLEGSQGNGSLVSGEEGIQAVRFMEKAMESARKEEKIMF